MDHNRDADELSPGSADDEGDSTPAIVLNTQSNLLSNNCWRRDTVGKSKVYCQVITHLKSNFFFSATNRIKWKSSHPSL